MTDTFEAVILELPKFVKYADKSKSKNLNLWVKFLKNPEVRFMDEKIAKKLLKNGYDVKEVAEITELTEEEILKLN